MTGVSKTYTYARTTTARTARAPTTAPTVPAVFLLIKCVEEGVGGVGEGKGKGVGNVGEGVTVVGSNGLQYTLP